MAELVKGKAALKAKAKSKATIEKPSTEADVAAEAKADAIADAEANMLNRREASETSTSVVIRKTSALKRAVAQNPSLSVAVRFAKLQAGEAPLTEDHVSYVPTPLGRPIAYTHDKVEADMRRGYRKGFANLAEASIVEALDALEARKAAEADAALDTDGIPE